MTRKAYALWPLAIAALVVTGSFVLLYKDRALEAWYLYRFESTHDSVRETAREGLVAVRSVRAVPLFLGSTDEALEGPAGEILKELDASGMSRLGHALLAHEPGLLLRIVALHGSLEAPRGTLAPLLKHALRSPNSGVRRYAAEELSRLGPEALPALTELRKATADQLEEVRLWASLALHGIDPERFSVSKLLAEEQRDTAQERLALAGVPLEIARTLASLPAEILRLRVDYSTSEAEVAEARRAWFEAQAGIRELQAISIEGGDPMRQEAPRVPDGRQFTTLTAGVDVTGEWPRNIRSFLRRTRCAKNA